MNTKPTPKFMQNKDVLKVSDRDRSILLFLWRWKVFTSAALTLKFFEGSTIVAYNRLRLLEKAGFIRSVVCDQGNKNVVWTLDRLGFLFVRQYLPSLKEEGYASEAPLHDLISAAFHLGEWIAELPEGVELVTEQELRRNEPQNYPDWVPDLSGRRPDGLWLIPAPESKKIFALETEITRKNPKDYGPIASFYRDQPLIARVFWLTNSLSQARRLHLEFEKVTPDRYLKHNFLTFDDFRLSGWNAPIVFGFEAGKPFHFALRAGQELKSEATVKRPLSFNAASLLDARKCPFRSTTSSPETREDFLDSMTLRPYPNPFPNLNLENIN